MERDLTIEMLDYRSIIRYIIVLINSVSKPLPTAFEIDSRTLVVISSEGNLVSKGNEYYSILADEKDCVFR